LLQDGAARTLLADAALANLDRFMPEQICAHFCSMLEL